MEYLVVNSVGKYKEKTLEGRKYLVVPVRMIVEGVMNGSKGPLFYSSKQIVANYSHWNHIPLVAPTHPTLNNKPISAKLPSIRLKYGIGYVNDAIANKSYLDANAYLDILLANKVDNRIVPWIRKGTPIEVSTGLGADVEIVENGNYKGSPYIGNAVNFKPDHLAILCNEVGACSVAMGCGIGVVNKRNYSRGVLITNETSVKEPSMDKKGIWAKLGELIGIVPSETLVTNEASYMDIIDAINMQLKEKYQTYHKEMYPNKSSWECPSMPYIRDIFSDSVIFYYDGASYKLGYTTAANDTVTLVSEEPVEVQQVTTYQEVTTNAISLGKNVKDLVVDDLWEPVVNPYPNEHAGRLKDPSKFLKNTFRRKELSKGISAIMGKMSAGGPMMIQAIRFDKRKFTAEEAKAWMNDHYSSYISFESATNKEEESVVQNAEVTNNVEPSLITNQEGNTTMPLTPEVRKSMVDGLIANCNCQHNVPWKGKDVNTLNSLSDDTIQAYDSWRKTLDGTPVAPVVNSQPVTQTVLTQNNPHQDSFFVDAAGNRFLMNPITNQLVKVNGAHLQTNVPQIPSGTAAPVQQTQVVPTQVSNSNPTNPANIQAYLNDKFKDAPPEVINAWNTMQETFVREKASLVEKLTINMQGEVKDQAVNIYNAMDIPQLRTLAAGLPNQQTQQQTPVVNWLGNAPVPLSGSTVNEKPLETPKVNWKECVTNKVRKNGS